MIEVTVATFNGTEIGNRIGSVVTEARVSVQVCYDLLLGQINEF
jgi:hypothetical protein